ncbi:MAG: hypothetical protein ACODAD_06425 [Planctomycetota bacterium]
MPDPRLILEWDTTGFAMLLVWELSLDLSNDSVHILVKQVANNHGHIHSAVPLALDRLHEELKTEPYRPMTVRRKLIRKAGQPGKFPLLGIPALMLTTRGFLQ